MRPRHPPNTAVTSGLTRRRNGRYLLLQGGAMGTSHGTLVDLCRHHARVRPSSAAYAWLSPSEIEALCLTYAELDRRARCVGAQIAALGLAGKNVLLLYDAGLEFVVAFLGGIYGCS